MTLPEPYLSEMNAKLAVAQAQMTLSQKSWATNMKRLKVCLKLLWCLPLSAVQSMSALRCFGVGTVIHPCLFSVDCACFYWFNQRALPVGIRNRVASLNRGTMVTCLEFITGVIVNIWLKLGVWDYSGLPLNILGQVCLPFYFAWVGLSVVAIVFDDYLRYWFFG